MAHLDAAKAPSFASKLEIRLRSLEMQMALAALGGKTSPHEIYLHGHLVTIQLDDETWAGLTEIAERETTTIHEISRLLMVANPRLPDLTAALQVYTLNYFRDAVNALKQDRSAN
jgi:predicted DNA-binding ribbon-helix-helix protein